MADRKKDKQRSTKHHTENKDGAMNPINKNNNNETGSELRCSGRVCSTGKINWELYTPYAGIDCVYPAEDN